MQTCAELSSCTLPMLVTPTVVSPVGRVRASESRHVANALRRDRVGNLIAGKYRIEKQLGVGGMAAVFAATHVRNAHRVALKVMHPELARHSALREQLFDEGSIANRVGHPATARVFDDEVTEDGRPLLVMELLDGETIAARWARRRAPLAVHEVAHFMVQLLDVLATIHEKGVVHRDISPDNVFLVSGGSLRVLDFGLASVRERGSRKEVVGVMGTPAFMPPEAAQGRTGDVGTQSDLWAAGALAFTLLTGRYVHAASTVKETIARARHEHARSLADVAPEVPRGVANVVDRALAFEPNDRWRDATAMKTALLSAYRKEFGRTPSPIAPRARFTEESLEPESAKKLESGVTFRMRRNALPWAVQA